MSKSKQVLLLSFWIGVAACGGDDFNAEPTPDGGSGTSGAGGSDDGGGSGGSGDGGASGDGGGSGDGGAPGDGGTATGGSAGTAVDAGMDADTGDSGSPDPTLSLTVDPGSGRSPISPYVYGMNEVEPARRVSAKAVRFGGHWLSGYNWEINATNARNGNAHLNVALGAGAEPGAAVSAVLAEAQLNGGLALLTIPIGDYVAADANGDDVLQTQDHLTTRFVQNVAVKGAELVSPPDTTDGTVYQDEFVAWVQSAAGTTPVAFSLDNEPGLWDIDHIAFHPENPTYESVVQRGIEFAKAVKNVWPEAGVTGPVSYGWLGMRNLQEAPDSDKGDFLEHYLDEMAVASAGESRRLLDYLDFHWWSEIYVNSVRIVEDDSSPDVVAARMQAPRSLWDPTYREDSWIVGVIGEPLQLIPRMKETIDAHYPGTKLALTAWGYGGGGHISGAIATADALGILGREGVAIATAMLTGQSQFTVAGFSAYLNYDGSGAHFGDTSVEATTSDASGSSVYASVDSGSENAVTIIALNKRDSERETTLTIEGGASYATCDVWELTNSGATFVSKPALTASAGNTFSYRMPPLSIAVLVPRP